MGTVCFVTNPLADAWGGHGVATFHKLKAIPKTSNDGARYANYFQFFIRVRVEYSIQRIRQVWIQNRTTVSMDCLYHIVPVKKFDLSQIRNLKNPVWCLFEFLEAHSKQFRVSIDYAEIVVILSYKNFNGKKHHPETYFYSK